MNGEFAFTVQVSDGIGSVARGMSITVGKPVSTTPVLSVSPSTLSFGSSTNQKSFIIANIGGGTLNWSVSCNQPWLSVSPSSGSGNATVMVSADRNGLNSGNYEASITISSNGGTQNISISIQAQK
jgi:hypothetical protein